MECIGEIISYTYPYCNKYRLHSFIYFTWTNVLPYYFCCKLGLYDILSRLQNNNIINVYVKVLFYYHTLSLIDVITYIIIMTIIRNNSTFITIYIFYLLIFYIVVIIIKLLYLLNKYIYPGCFL